MGTLESNCEEDMIIDEPIVIENLCDDVHNIVLLDYLNLYRGWKLAHDFTAYGHSEPTVDTNIYSDGGCEARTFEVGEDIPEKSTHLNEAAYFILSKIGIHLGIKKYIPYRYTWNYYNRSSTGTPHTDYEYDNFISVLYNLNTNDGGTIINDKMYNSVAGRAVIFKSNVLHHGVGPTKSAQRYNLNIVFAES
jgi:hypothetical protein